MRKVDDTAQTENDGQTQRNQQVIKPKQQTIGDLLHDKYNLYRQDDSPSAWQRRAMLGAPVRLVLKLQENTQVLPSASASSFVGNRTSRLSSGPGTGLLVTMKSLGPALGLGLGSTVYIS